MPIQETSCVIDLIVKKQEKAYILFEDEQFIAFLDHRPLFPGHTLLALKRITKHFMICLLRWLAPCLF